jgi:murein DD-endopeptidase MepM/ murein hydrolase activator NlpD
MEINRGKIVYTLVLSALIGLIIISNSVASLIVDTDELEQARKKDAKSIERTVAYLPQQTTLKAEGAIYGSFYQSAMNAGVGSRILNKAIKALSYDIDFQRDIKRGDKFVILYDAVAKGSKVLESYEPKYIKLTLRKREVEIFIDGDEYFYRDGSSAKKSLLRTPIDGARITSGFGMRFHPILGYSKMHKGTDFGAPTGTPIYAAGNGTVEKAGYNGAYGNYVRIKHNATYSTAYAHASRIAPGIKAGKTVKQGQVIAYVGSTGRSTGPHLHYEVLQKGAQINPASIKIDFGNKLTGKALANFKAKQAKILAELEKAPTRKDYAAQFKASAI